MRERSASRRGNAIQWGLSCQDNGGPWMNKKNHIWTCHIFRILAVSAGKLYISDRGGLSPLWRKMGEFNSYFDMASTARQIMISSSNRRHRISFYLRGHHHDPWFLPATAAISPQYELIGYQFTHRPLGTTQRSESS